MPLVRLDHLGVCPGLYRTRLPSACMLSTYWLPGEARSWFGPSVWPGPSTLLAAAGRTLRSTAAARSRATRPARAGRRRRDWFGRIDVSFLGFLVVDGSWRGRAGHLPAWPGRW